jgi:hypothetical protein
MMNGNDDGLTTEQKKSQKKIESDNGLTPEQISMFKNVVRDPVLFATHVLGLDLWPKEVEILRSIKNHRRTAIKACHGVGKTFTLAVAALWWLARYREGIVLTTSSTQRQVRTQLWLEIHKLVKGAKIRYPELKSTSSSSAATIISQLVSPPTSQRTFRAIMANSS